MGNGYSVAAFDYNKGDIGIDPDTDTKFVPNEKELELFKKEKMNLYKGTWTVCFVYGISAFILLVIVLFTDMGRNYIYNKYFPAVMTYVIGAIIIIIYLIYSIFNIKPRKLGKAENKLNNCPDYWSYVREEIPKTTDLISNMKENNKNTATPISSIDNEKKINKGVENQQYILNNKDDVKLDVETSSLFINFKCKADEQIYGSIEEQKSMKDDLYGDVSYKMAYRKSNTTKPGYLITDLGELADGDSEIDTKLKKYAQVSGVYKNQFSAENHLFDNSLRLDSNTDISNAFYKDIPLICNEVYPNILSKLEKEGSNDVRCEYARKCNISWSDIDCYKNKDVKLNTI
jgi:hypothetical protein